MIPGILEAVTTLGGMILPPLTDVFRKKILGKDDDSPDRTLATLATTRPEVMPDFVRANSEHLRAQSEYFNRDVSGAPSQWVIDMRAVIRPLVTCIAMLALGVGYFGWFTVDEGTRVTFCTIAGSWFGDRFNVGKRVQK